MTMSKRNGFELVFVLAETLTRPDGDTVVTRNGEGRSDN